MFKMILANDIVGGIGKENQLPWPRNDKDMQWVKEHTKNAILICGRKTYESFNSVVHIITINSLSLRAIRLSLSVLKMQTLLQLSLNQKWNLKIKILLNTTMSYSLII